MSTNEVDRRSDVRVTQQPGIETREVVTEDVNTRKRQTLERVSAMIVFAFGTLEGLIGLRMLLKLMDANSKNAFASSIYNVTSLFLAPFAGLTGNPAIGGNVLEVTSFIAMIVYALVAWGIVRLVWLLFYQPSTRTVSTYEREQSPASAPRS